MHKRNTVTETNTVTYTDHQGKTKELPDMTEDNILDELMRLEHRRACLRAVFQTTSSPVIRHSIDLYSGSIVALVAELDRRHNDRQNVPNSN